MMDGCSDIDYFQFYYVGGISVGSKYYEGVLGGMLVGVLVGVFGGRLFGLTVVVG
jgi:hypothetical protein